MGKHGTQCLHKTACVLGAVQKRGVHDKARRMLVAPTVDGTRDHHDVYAQPGEQRIEAMHARHAHCRIDDAQGRVGE
jgi:hypothetical protein